MRKCPGGPKALPPDLIRLRFPPRRHGERKLMTLEKTGDRPSTAPRVVVVGAGFAGLYTIRGLKKSGYRVTILDKNLYATFQPLLYQVATGGLNPGDVSYAVGGFARKFHAKYDRGELTAIDPEARQITLADGRQIGYDY